MTITDQDGRSGSFDELIQRAKDEGNYSEVSRGPSSSEVDLDMTHALCIHTTLKSLNEWARERGDEFSISSVGWIDERGWIEPNNAATENPPTTDTILTVSGGGKDRTEPVYPGARNASVVVLINGREAIPVRAIPYMADTTVSADTLVRGLLCADHTNSLYGLSAYRRLSYGRLSNSALKVSAVEWRRFANKLQALSDGIERQERNGELTHAEGTDKWKRESVRLLPAGVFLWKDEFHMEHFKSFRRLSNEELAQSYSDGIEINRELVSASEDSYTAELMAAQGAPENWREVMQAGIDEAAAEGPFNPDGFCVYVPDRCEPRGTDALSDVTFHPMIEQDEMHIVMQGFEHMSDGPTDGKCIELARLPELRIADWIKLTGVGLGWRGAYHITKEGVSFVTWDKDRINSAPLNWDSAPLDWQIDMERDNEQPPLKFPCTPNELLHFVDTARHDLYGFSVPDAFRQAVTDSAPTTNTAPQGPDAAQGQTAISGATENPTPEVTPDADEQGEATTLEQGEVIDHDAALANLFNAVKAPQLEAMFPDGGKWKSHAERANRNGLKSSRTRRGEFNPYLAAVWWINSQGPTGWKWERCLRVLANNLPARSIDSKHLLTGEFD